MSFPGDGGSMYRRAAGERRRTLSRIVFEEYNVVANNIATALSRESARKAAGPYSLKRP